MDAFMEAFYSIDQDHSESITIKELEDYTLKNDMDPSFIDRWRKIFDPDDTGAITLTKFCETLGLEVDEVRQNIMSKRENNESDVSKLPEYVEISVDMSEEMQRDIILMTVEGVKQYPDSDSSLVKWMKMELDKRYGRLWHCVVVRGQYFSFYSYQPGYSFCFKIGPRIYIVYKTPGFGTN